jgi:chromosome segregation ATPase
MESESEALVKRALLASIRVSELFEDRERSAIPAFDEFRALALEALDAREMDITRLQMKIQDYADQRTQKHIAVQTSIDHIRQERGDWITMAETIKRLRHDIISIGQTNAYLTRELEEEDMQYEDFQTIQAQIVELKEALPEFKSVLAAERHKQARILARISAEKCAWTASREVMQRIIRKNQRKETEIEAIIRRASPSSRTPPPVSAPASPVPAQIPTSRSKPSLIIHKTDQEDDVRLFRTIMERCLTINTDVRTELDAITADMEALQEENEVLRGAVRDLGG